VGEWIVGLAGTPEGARLASLLALNSALMHALFGALQKGKHDPWVSRGAIDAALVVMTAPIALFLVPWPDAQLFLVLIGVVIIHLVYKVTMALSYERAAYTVVYPVVRGTGPLVTVIAASLIFHEHFAPLQWVGVACLSGGILLLALRNLSEEKIDPHRLRTGLAWALAGGLMVAVYTTYDAWGIRVAENPFTFLAWCFFLSSIDMPIIALLRQKSNLATLEVRPLVWRGVIGAVIAWISFGGVMLATRLDKVGEAAVLRETSTVFAALIGWLLLGEKVGPRKAILMAVIALGAVLVEIGG
jgi:multidrug transporter EmrE-like cation transporter